MPTRLVRLPDSELDVMLALWQASFYPATTAEINSHLNRNWKTPTILKLLLRLEEKGFVLHEKDDRTNLYTPLVEKDDYLRFASRSFLARVHNGSFLSLLSALCPDMDLSEEDRKELERILKGASQ